MPFVVEIARQGIAKAKGIVAVEVVIGAPFGVKSPRAVHVSYVLVNHNVVRSLYFFAEMWVLCGNKSEDIGVHKGLPSAVTILQIVFLEARPVGVIFDIIVGTEAQTVALSPHCLDANDALHGGIIAGTGTRDDLDGFYIRGLQLLEFALILHLFVVDIDLGCAF